MSNEIWIVYNRSVLHSVFTCKLFSKEINNVQILTEANLIKKFHDYMFLEDKNELCLIVDVECSYAISKLLQILSISLPQIVEKLKVIIVSNVESWGGKRYLEPIEDLESAFEDRVPLARAFNTYALENQFLELAKSSTVNVCVMGLGLVFGGSGFDLTNVLRYIWDNGDSEETYALLCSRQVKPPIIHYRGFIRILSELINRRELPHYMIASDRSTMPLFEILTEADKRINQVSCSRLEPADYNSLLEALCEDASVSSWTCDMFVGDSNFFPTSGSPSISYESASLSDNFDCVWTEYIEDNNLNPLHLSIVGPPSSGKSELAKLVAEKLGVEYIDVATAVKFLLSTEFPGDGLVSSLPANASDKVRELQKALAEEVRAKIAEASSGGKKPVKGAPPPTEADSTAEPIDMAIVTEQFCRSLTESFLRQCVLAMLRLSSRCVRRGCILDLWDGRVLTGAESLQEILGLAIVGNEDDQQTLSESASGQDQTNEPSNSKHTSRNGTEEVKTFRLQTLIELQCEANSPVQKLTASFGANLKAKESQAAIKALEALLTDYNGQMVDIQSSDVSGCDQPADTTEGTKEESQPLHCLKSHKEVTVIEGDAEKFLLSPVLRVDGTVSEERTVDAIAEMVFAIVCKQRNDMIGWIKSSKKAANNDSHPSDEESKTAEEGLTSTKEIAKPSTETVPSNDLVGAEGIGKNSALAEQLRSLKEDNVETLKKKSTELEEFLNATVLAQITAGMVTILRDQPEDPIRYLSDYLREHSDLRRADAEEAARIEFEHLLSGH